MRRHGYIDLMVLLFTSALGGCNQRNPDVWPADSMAIRDSQVAVVNAVLLANHPHFTAGRSRAPSLNVDAFDFMLGRPMSEFASLFAAAGGSMSAVEIERKYPDWPMASWMRKTQQASEGELTFYLLFTEIGRTFGYDGQADFLVIATEAGTVKEWALFAITEY